MDEHTTVDLDTSTQDGGELTPTSEEVNGSTEESVDWQSAAKKNEELANNYKIRAEKAEAKLKEKTPAAEQKTINKPQQEEQKAPEGLSRDEAKLYAKGLDDAQVDKIKQIAKIENISLSEAATSDFFSIWDEKRKAEERAEKAQLSASKGSKAVVKKDVNTPGLSRDEHMALWKEKHG